MTASLVHALESPEDYQHIVLLYDSEEKRDSAIAQYLNEGLKRNQLCVYASIRVSDEGHLKKMSSKIQDYEENVRKQNLLVVDLAPSYIAAMSHDLVPFEKAKNDFSSRARERADKHIRFVGDAVGLLFENRHFEECLAVEGWWQQKPFVGSYMCTFEKSLLDIYPHNNHKKSILTIKHDIIIDAEEVIAEKSLVAVNSKDDHDTCKGTGNMGGSGRN